LEKSLDDKGNLVCTDCQGGPSSEPVEDLGSNIWIALCSTCKDWADFQYENEMEE